MLSLILSLIAGILTTLVVLTTIREHARLIGHIVKSGVYEWNANGVNSALATIAAILWVIVAHLK